MEIAGRHSSPIRAGWFVAALVGTILYWLYALSVVDLDEVGTLGLVSALPVIWYAAPAIFTVSFATALYVRARRWLLWAHVVVFVLVVHATPVILYGNLRYSWAWKHVGVVDYLQRGNGLWTDAPYLTVYHNWPSFFTASTALTDAAGFERAVSLATWAPVFFQLLGALCVAVLFRALTDDRRTLWLGVWLFLLSNWIGQDYFAPQAFAYVLYLLVLAVVLRYFRTGRAEEISRGARTGLAALLVVMMLAIATAHPLTPLVLTASLVALFLFRIVRAWWLPVAAIVTTFGWWVLGARDYVGTSLRSALSEFGALLSNSRANGEAYDLDASQQLVSTAGRGVVVLMVLLALGGAIRRWRAGNWDWAPAILAVVPVTMLVAGSYGGEVLFRVYLFALPFLALLGAGLFFPTPSSRFRWRGPVLTVAISVALLAGFLLAHFGKDAWYRFTTDEVRVAEALYETAPPGSLLVEGSRNYPSRFANYERFTYVSIANEPAESVDELLADPVTKLEEWLSDDRYAGAYVIITRAQKIENDSIGPLPKGALESIEQALESSDRFTVLFGNEDAKVFTLAEERL